MNGGARRIVAREIRPGTLGVEILGRAPSARTRDEIAAAVRTMFALVDDLSAFYALLENDDDLGYARRGVGRLLRAPTAFEEVARTICTTNCAWSGTIRMITALVEGLGAYAGSGSKLGAAGHAFPSAQAVADAPEKFFRDVARAGYRGAYLRKLGAMVAGGEVELEALRSAPRSELSDDELERQLLALPGVGPYAAAHVMLLFGRCSRLVLDSWTRPTYMELVGKKKMTDKAIVRRFKRYGSDAGLAFWLFLWKNRHEA